jgi:hypothetical protein
MANKAADVALLRRTFRVALEAGALESGPSSPARTIVADAVAALGTRGARPQTIAEYAATSTTLTRTTWEDVGRALAGAPEDVPQAAVGAGGPVRSSDLVNLAVCALTASLMTAGIEPPRAALVASARTLAAIAAERYPGRTIEVRVPPAAAVQIGFGTGPVHTRGTPPNVIETDPATFVRLGTGGLAWDAALAAHLVTASGDAADLSAALPLLDLRVSPPPAR